MAYDPSSLFGMGTDLASYSGIGGDGMPVNNGSYSPDVGMTSLPAQQFSMLTTPGYNPYSANNPRANANGLVPLSNVGGDPNARSIYADLKNAGLSDAQIQQYGAAATSAAGSVGGLSRDPAIAMQGKDWASNYMSVLNQVAKDNPQLAQKLSQNITPALQQSSRAYAGSMGAQSAEAAAGSGFDKFMGQWGWTLPIAGAAAAAGGAALAAGSAAGAGAGAGAGAAGAFDATAAGIDAGGMAGVGGAGGLASGMSGAVGDGLAAMGAGGAADSGVLANLGADQMGNAAGIGDGGFLNVSAPDAISTPNIGASFPSDFVSSSSAGGVPTAADVGSSAAPFSMAGGGAGAQGGNSLFSWLNNAIPGSSNSTSGGLFGNGGILGSGVGNGSGFLGSGFSGSDLLKSGLNYFIQNRNQRNLNSQAQNMLNAGNALNQPQRAPYQAASLNMVQNPSQYLNTDPFATAMRDYYKNSVIPAQVARSGNPSQVVDQSGSQFNTSVAQDYNQKLQTLAGYGGFNQMANSFTGNPAGQLFGAGAAAGNNAMDSLPMMFNSMWNGNNRATSQVPGQGINPVKQNPISNSTLNFSQ